jgi:hypothetical protein
VPHLTDAERTLYHQLTSQTWARHRRIEQERIPLAVALEHVRDRDRHHQPGRDSTRLATFAKRHQRDNGNRNGG